MAKIAIDLDNCIFDVEPIYQYGFEGTNTPFYLPNTWEVVKCYPKEISRKIIHAFEETDMVYKTKALDKSLYKFINNIIKNNTKHEIHIITARIGNKNPIIYNNTFFSSHVLFKTYQQLKKAGYNIPLQNIHVVNKNKISALKEYNIDYMIDDAPHIIEECLNNNVTPILISTDKTPYNHILKDKVKHFSCVKDALISIL